jgi:2-polyprenyl-3-methyl-5-hydroxy-6-metoxy-1,4-benzoquinol methylase
MGTDIRQHAEIKRRVAALGDCHLRWRPLMIGSERFDVAACSGADLLLDALIAADPAHPAVRDERLPYWTEIWPASVVVAGAALEAGGALAGKAVLDLGCGLGVAGMAAGRAGARVCLCDYDPQAVRFAALNWVANVDAEPRAVVMDWRAPVFEAAFDLILAADIVYEKRFFEPIIRAFDRLLKPGGRVWLGEPDRHFSRGFFAALERAGYGFSRTVRRVDFPNPEKPTDVSLYTISKKIACGSAMGV